MSEAAVDAPSRPGHDAKNTQQIYAVVLTVGMCCGLAIVTVYEMTKPIIAKNRIAMRERAILNVLPAASSSRAFAWDENEHSFLPAEPNTPPENLVFAGFDDAGKLVGLAIETKGMGYQDFIRIIYGYSPQQQAIIGVRVLESRETPGLGDRIEKDADFLDNFEALDVRLADASLGNTEPKLANEIEFVKFGEKTNPWQIDGITGATISSRATANMLTESSKTWMPRIYPLRSQFKPAGNADQRVTSLPDESPGDANQSTSRGL